MTIFMRPLKIALLSLTLAVPSLAFAIGGNDPVPGIDIIIKKILAQNLLLIYR